MLDLPKKLLAKLEKRREEHALRELSISKGIDFSSNDYLGFSRNSEIGTQALKLLESEKNTQNGATGSRLLTGNYPLLERLEQKVATFHKAEAALVFNSGYDANLGFFSSVPQRSDIILYDELCHASIRDGIQLSHAKSYKFKHNDLNDLQTHVKRCRDAFNDCEIYIVTESVFSMDGDTPDLAKLARYCLQNNSFLIVDEAHTCGVFGDGKGMVAALGLEDRVFARLVTFGKAFAGHGAAWLGNTDLKAYLVNYARSFMYTTAMPPHTCATVFTAYQYIQTKKGREHLLKLQNNIDFFKKSVHRLGLKTYFGTTDSAIQICWVSGNERAKLLEAILQKAGFDVRAILSPTVPKRKERLRICLHAHNTEEEIDKVLQILKDNVKTN